MPWPPRGWAPTAKLPASLNADTLAQWQLTGAGGTKQNNNQRQSTFLQKLADRYLSSLLAHVRPSTPANASTLTANTPHISFLSAFPSSFLHHPPTTYHVVVRPNVSMTRRLLSLSYPAPAAADALCSTFTILVRDLFCPSVSPITNVLLFALADALRGLFDFPPI